MQSTRAFLKQHGIKGWQVIGNIIIVKSNFTCSEADATAALLRLNPSCNTVLCDFGIHGQFREPDRRLISGTTTETVHKENGCFYKLDTARIMFSQGNLNERIRMSRLGAGEVVVDMFAGIGYFTIPMAVHARPRRIYAIELNPVAYHYLCENVHLNGVADIVETLHGDCAELTPISAADRVIMGYVGTTHEYLEYGVRSLKDGGVLHFHETVPTNLADTRPRARIEDAARQYGRRCEILGQRTIKKYSPGVEHVVVDARIY